MKFDRRGLRNVLVIFSVAALWVVTPCVLGIRFNLSGSHVSPGVWRAIPVGSLRVGDTIAYDIDEFYALRPQVREERMNFIAPRILKTVAGLPGALIEMSGDIVTIDGTAYPRARVASGSWRKVEYPLVVPEGTVWLMANSETAYDSRYHGPLPENIIKEKMVPILVIKK